MSREVSRRKFLFAGGAALAAPTILTSCTGTPNVPSLSESDRALSAIAGSGTGFDAAVEALFPGLTRDPVFQKIAPLALLVTHQQGPPVRAFSASWSIMTPTGTYEAPLYFYVSLGSPAAGHILSALGSARRDILSVGQSRLVTPFFNWTPASYQSNPKPDWKTVLKPTEPGAFLVSQLPKAAKVEVSLDAALFSDWKVIGRDKHKLAFRIQTRRNAEHDEGLAVYKLLKSGASDREIVNTLEEHGSAPRSGNSKPNQRWYRRARKVHAQILLKAFQNADRQTFTKALHRLKKQPKTRITNLAA